MECYTINSCPTVKNITDMDLIIRPVSCLVLYVIKKVDYSYGFHLYSVTTPGTFQNMMCSCNCMKKPNILTTLSTFFQKYGPSFCCHVQLLPVSP